MTNETIIARGAVAVAGQVICEVPDVAYDYSLTVSNDGVRESQGILIIVYNPLCYTCDVHAGRCPIKVRNAGTNQCWSTLLL